LGIYFAFQPGFSEGRTRQQFIYEERKANRITREMKEIT